MGLRSDGNSSTLALGHGCPSVANGTGGDDYRRGDREAKINAVPNFITEINGLDIHFIHGSFEA